ncbi:MAG: PEP-CTERM sorting domain-containing protein [Phycisphaeraceae bacterium]|nr:PEP-CTERM sorting domain-containing protein [Phycisphaeraceae bacterium]
MCCRTKIRRHREAVRRRSPPRLQRDSFTLLATRPDPGTLGLAGLGSLALGGRRRQHI